METKTENKNKVSSLVHAIGKTFIRPRKEEREMLRDLYNIGLDSFNAYIPRVGTDNVLLAIAIEYHVQIINYMQTAQARSMFYQTRNKAGEVHGGQCEVAEMMLGDYKATVIWHSAENTFVLAGMVREMQLLTRDELLDVAVKGECYNVQTTLPEGNFFDGKSGLIMRSGVLIGNISKTRQSLLCELADGTPGVLCLHSGRKGETERCNATSLLGVTEKAEADKIRAALFGALVSHKARSEKRKVETTEARKARRKVSRK